MTSARRNIWSPPTAASRPAAGCSARLFAAPLVRAVARPARRAAAASAGSTRPCPTASRRRVGFHAPGPVAVVHLHSWMALVRLATSGSVGWYKAWARGRMVVARSGAVVRPVHGNARQPRRRRARQGAGALVNALAHRLRDNDPGQARDNIAAHYDLGNDFYAAWLDPSMTYSSARLRRPGDDARGGAAAQDRRCCSTGSTSSPATACSRSAAAGARWRSRRRGAGRQVVGLTLSAEQKAWADARIAEAGLADRIEIRLHDYRDVDEQFDADRLGRDGRGGRRALLARLSRLPSPAT